MTLPSIFQGKLKVPVVAAPMFLVSGTELVINACKAGVIGTFPALNARSSEEFANWLDQIKNALKEEDAPYGVNIPLSAHRRVRLSEDLAVMKSREVPLVITSIGNPKEIVEEIHGYGGLVFHDVTTLRHARKAAQAGVDGLILVCAGAGGHGGALNPFAFVEQVRQFFDGTIILAGSISTGRAVRAALTMGADLTYVGTRFIATQEALGPENYKNMLVSEATDDVIYTDAISGLNANFMASSLLENGLDPKNLPKPKAQFQPDLPQGLTAWRDIWSAGQGVGLIDDIPTVANLVERLRAEFNAAE
ncbi:MAG: nitronate monooxygenase [Sneathiellales bacterium]|nr:nitronate monooxygenase [Sneathiellales bacterium]